MKLFSSNYLSDLLNTARQSKRLRAHANLHQSHQDPCQRLFNALNSGSYIRPHRHSLDPKDECLMAIKGLFSLIIFSNCGVINSITIFGSEKYSEEKVIASGVEVPAGVWHTVISLTHESILFEVKSGPFDPSLAKELAPWAPEEGGANAPQYLSLLKQKSFDELSKVLKVKISL
ncbi:WbuC family cupin fold metalloprotein [Polynucleobacter sp. AP-Sanab-80-C2]|uniref:WbuC family cupin fold metalloprotein n=1 Tax=Polynucleobacter sp. AP-Sanab-80-C2 TaxID=3108274 RepID=UPI002B23B3A4|nr:WbuC family cupin fold metalloprotein [Polynucleobacter sp. AP-Sanab-80-C2]MEA9598540.1 WbuC family cupin fold metalloprotein [Polynucleobacter sp. AP-Sanab-80-C2]